jgi:putative ABC transport system substrate-binding protein
MFGPPDAEAARFLLDPFRQGLHQFGWNEGQNIKIDYRFAGGTPSFLPALASELVRLGVEVIVIEGTPAAQAAKNATLTIPIVMVAVTDPVGSGLVASFNRPGGNVTGLSLISNDLASKRLQLLTEIVPRLARVVALYNGNNPATFLQLEQTKSAAKTLSIDLVPVSARAPGELDNAFAAINGVSPGALLIEADGMLYAQRERIMGFSVAARLPALFPQKEVAQAGGLLAYGPSIPGNFRRAAAFVDKILSGANPGDLPIEGPTTFELAVNLKTAKALGLAVPTTLLARADEVIE